jgi:beta-1,4-N-acetylglucosaminyltransferase
MRLLVALGGGGHTKEMVTLLELMGGDYEYGYVLLLEDDWSQQRLPFPGPVYRVLRPGGQKKHNVLRDVWNTAASTIQAIGIVRKFRPKAMLTSGAGIALSVGLACKLARVKIIFVETGSRVTALSTTGRIMYRMADLFLVQSQALADAHPRAAFAGRLW